MRVTTHSAAENGLYYREIRTLRKLAITLAVIGLVASPIAAQSDMDTVGEENNGIFGGADAAPIILFALAALTLGIFVSGEDEDEPVSA